MNAPRCSAHSSRTGRPCKRLATLGATVCRSHGAAAPQVLKSARERLAALVDPSIEGLRKALDKGSHADVIRAAVAVLDRAGHGPKSSLALSSPEEGEGSKLETIVRIIVDPGQPSPSSLADLTDEQLRQVSEAVGVDYPKPKAATFRTLPAAKPGKSSPPGDSTSDPPSAPAVEEEEL